MLRFRDPFDTLLKLQRALDATRQSNWFGPSTTSRGAFPPVNVFQRPDSSYVIAAELPGVRKEDLDVQIRNKNVRISGKKLVEHGEKESVHRRERVGGSFDRTVTLPVRVDPDSAEARFEDGVLTLSVHIAESEKPRTVQIA